MDKSATPTDQRSATLLSDLVELTGRYPVTGSSGSRRRRLVYTGLDYGG